MCYQESQESQMYLSPEEIALAEESFSNYNKPVVLYDILQQRALKHPLFLQRSLSYKIPEKRQRRLRAGNVIFNYKYHNNRLRKTEVTEDFSCPFCLVHCASFKGLQLHLNSSHDLFNFEFWVTEDYHSVNVSFKNEIWRYEGNIPDVDGSDIRFKAYFFRRALQKRQFLHSHRAQENEIPKESRRFKRSRPNIPRTPEENEIPKESRRFKRSRPNIPRTPEENEIPKESRRFKRSRPNIPRSPEIEQALEDAFAPLNDDEEADVERALNGGNSEEVLVKHENSNIEITRGLLQCLLLNGLLNDDVINLYLELLKEREKREPVKFLKCHFFNTFFYKMLYKPNTRYDYKAVSSWTQSKIIGYSLMDCEKIFVPIHKENHWCLAIIDMEAKKFQYLDSFRKSDAHVLDVLVKYITDEAKDKTGQDLDVSSWETQLVEDLPQQENGSDCGMFMIKYADFHSRGLPLNFFQTHMPYFRKRTAKEILRLKAE